MKNINHDHDKDNDGGDDVSFVEGYDSIVYQSDFRANPMKLAGALTTVTCVTSIKTVMNE